MSHGFTSLLTMVYRTTRCPEAVPLSSATSVEVTQVFIGKCAVYFCILECCGWKPGCETPSHKRILPGRQANSLCESFNRSTGHSSLSQKWELGPFQVLEAGDEHFLVDMGGRREKISSDRLKTAHMDAARPIELAPKSPKYAHSPNSLPFWGSSTPCPSPLPQWGPRDCTYSEFTWVTCAVEPLWSCNLSFPLFSDLVNSGGTCAVT